MYNKVSGSLVLGLGSHLSSPEFWEPGPTYNLGPATFQKGNIQQFLHFWESYLLRAASFHDILFQKRKLFTVTLSFHIYASCLSVIKSEMYSDSVGILSRVSIIGQNHLIE